MNIWKLFGERWAARAAQINALDRRVALLESQVGWLTENLIAVCRAQDSSGQIGNQINAHLAVRPKFNWGP